MHPLPSSQRALYMTAFLAALMAAGCTSPNGGTRATTHQVRYELTWKADQWNGQARAQERVLVNDLGYTVRLTRGYVVTRSMELVECPKTAFDDPLTLPSDLVPWLAPRAAYAGHTMGTPNPAAISVPRVESLTDAATVTAGTVSLAPQRYCQVHYLVARADQNTVNLPHDLDMVDSSLHAEGTYRARGAEQDTPFRLHTTVANGRLVDLFPPGRFGDAPAQFILDTGSDGADVVIRRDVDRLFNGMDFATMPEKTMVRQLLQNLIDTLQVEVRRRPDV